MQGRLKIPFQDMHRQGWQNLALAGILAFYLIQIALELAWRNTCGHLAIDYCAFWSAGRVANASGYTAVYDLGIIGPVQRAMFPLTADPAAFAISPVAYLAVFLLPFQVLALLPPLTGFWLWTALNAAILFYYLRFFATSIGPGQLPARLAAMLFLSLPAFLNFFTGQVNVWLAVCAGEFVRAALAGKNLRAGLWLGGFLLKPQALFLIAPAMLLQRRGRILAGLAASSIALFGISFAMAGAEGISRLAELWLGFAGGLPTNDVEIMMNWRMLGLHLGALFTPQSGPIAAIAGMALTVLATFQLWRRPIEPSSVSFVAALFGTLAATALFAWHSHAHMAMFLIPPMVYLHQHERLPRGLLEWWILLPASVYVLVFFTAALIRAGVLQEAATGLLNFARGASEFGLNLWILLWAIRRSEKPE
jgi:hypothetical protein